MRENWKSLHNLVLLVGFLIFHVLVCQLVPQKNQKKGTSFFRVQDRDYIELKIDFFPRKTETKFWNCKNITTVATLENLEVNCRLHAGRRQMSFKLHFFQLSASTELQKHVQALSNKMLTLF